MNDLTPRTNYEVRSSHDEYVLTTPLVEQFHVEVNAHVATVSFKESIFGGTSLHVRMWGAGGGQASGLTYYPAKGTGADGTYNFELGCRADYNQGPKHNKCKYSHEACPAGYTKNDDKSWPGNKCALAGLFRRKCELDESASAYLSQSGYEMNDGCSDKDECRSNMCGSGAYCRDYDGGFDCAVGGGGAFITGVFEVPTGFSEVYICLGYKGEVGYSENHTLAGSDVCGPLNRDIDVGLTPNCNLEPSGRRNFLDTDTCLSGTGGGASGIKVCETDQQNCRWLVVAGGGGGANVVENTPGKSSATPLTQPADDINIAVAQNEARGMDGVTGNGDGNGGKSFLDADLTIYSMIHTTNPGATFPVGHPPAPATGLGGVASVSAGHGFVSITELPSNNFRNLWIPFRTTCSCIVEAGGGAIRSPIRWSAHSLQGGSRSNGGELSISRPFSMRGGVSVSQRWDRSRPRICVSRRVLRGG